MPQQSIHQLIQHAALSTPHAIALLHRKRQVSYAQLWHQVTQIADQLDQLGLAPGSRIAVYLPKQTGMVACLFAASSAGYVFVPVNPLLKAAQVVHILNDAQASVLITNAQRLEMLKQLLPDCHHLQAVALQEDGGSKLELNQQPGRPSSVKVPEHLAAILYTSGSTGLPKGVMLSQQNLLLGAASVNQYLEINAGDRLLGVLPFSFDYGLNQLMSTFMAGASLVLMDYLFAKDVISAVSRYRITGVAGIPSLWKQLAALDWPPDCQQTLRYLTSSGGVMPVSTTLSLRDKLPDTDIFLMYGLTEAFRSTYLPADQIDKHADSIGIAIPYAALHLINAAGELCSANELGELVHSGPLVTMGYWNSPDRTHKRFRPLPGADQTGLNQMAVWSGDLMRQDEQGLYYFVGRMDAMIKTSGYRVSPAEIESVAQAANPHTRLAAVGIPHPALGQAILLVLEHGDDTLPQQLIDACKQQLPQYMVPLAVESMQRLPHNVNGKIDRVALARHYHDYFADIP